MTQTSVDDDQASVLLRELGQLLASEGITEPVNLHLRSSGDKAQIHLIAADFGRLGLLLALLSDPAELPDPGSLTCRMTPGDNDGTDDRWQYELIASRYPINQEIVFSAKVQLPAAVLPEVISRLRGRPGASVQAGTGPAR